MKLGMTKLAAIALSAAMFGGLSATSASALPYTSADRNLSSSNLIEDVQIRRGDRKYRNRGYRNRGYRNRSHSSRRYRAGRRYSHAPRNWRRYNSRPSYWRSRGCIIVGPIWFCP